MSLAAIADIRDEETGAIVGFQVGRAAALADWHFRKEQKAFRKLCRLLYLRSYVEAHREQRRDICRRYANKADVKARANERARARRARKPRPVLVCKECEARFTKRGRPGGTVPEFCRDACRQRYRYQERTPGARRIKRRLETTDAP